MFTSVAPARRIFLFRSRSSPQRPKESAHPTPADGNGTLAAIVTPAVVDSPSHTAELPDAPADSTVQAAHTPPAPAADAPDEKGACQPTPTSRPRRFSWFPTSFTGKDDAKVSHAKQALEHEKKPEQHTTIVAANGKRLTRTRSQQRARQSAIVLRDAMVGPSSVAPAKAKKRTSAAEVEKAKSQLLHPKTANKVIEQLKQMPLSTQPAESGAPNGEHDSVLPTCPIHAVCLAYSEEEAHEKHFSRLVQTPPNARDTQSAHPSTAERSVYISSQEIASVATASFTQLKEVFSEINVVSLMTTVDLGIGEPGDGPGILSGAVPTAETVLNGVEKVTPQLMALGYATGRAILPDHSGIYPPTDRMSVLTYWWGFEVAVPPPSLVYLENVPSIAHSVMNFLTALAIVEGGVREILPFVRYISQFIDTEFRMIKEQNKGRGVVCAATWIMPAALVPRPWDFPQPPVTAPHSPVIAPADGHPAEAPVNMPVAPISEEPEHAPAPASSVPSVSSAPPASESPRLSLPALDTEPMFATPASAAPVAAGNVDVLLNDAVSVAVAA